VHHYRRKATVACSCFIAFLTDMLSFYEPPPINPIRVKREEDYYPVRNTGLSMQKTRTRV
jgi:hypothetical protein